VAGLRTQGRSTRATSLTDIYSPISPDARPLRRSALGFARRAQVRHHPVDRPTRRLGAREVPDRYRIARGERLPQPLAHNLVEMSLRLAPLAVRDPDEHQQQCLGFCDLFRIIPTELCSRLLLLQP